MISNAAAACLSVLLVAMPALAEECKPGQGERQPVEAIIKALQQQGYVKVHAVEVRLMNCYDAVVVDKDGRRVELDVDPVSMQAYVAPPKDDD